MFWGDVSNGGCIFSRATLPAFAELGFQLLTTAGTDPRCSRGGRVVPFGHQGGGRVEGFIFNPQFGLEWERGNRGRHRLVVLNTTDARLLQDILEQTHLGGVR